MWLGTRQECIGSSSRVSGACQDSIREFTRRRSRLVGRLSRVPKKLIATTISACSCTSGIASSATKKIVSSLAYRLKHYSLLNRSIVAAASHCNTQPLAFHLSTIASPSSADAHPPLIYYCDQRCL
ncbi:hypothetical protein BHE74_00034083 [Ensete ventricosum]|nr:hypothetical protein BHE74_00034083 [Ensete ventricosum]